MFLVISSTNKFNVESSEVSEKKLLNNFPTMSLLLNMSCSDGRYVPWVSDQHKENVPEHFVANTTIY
jgi:hypothetical protein